MAAPMSIPRFLLPQTGLIWRRTANLGGLKGPEILLVRRYASTTRAKPIVLEKPEKFNPPSHGARLPKKTTPRHYGGPLTDEEANIQKRKEYPGLMAPKDTWAHWFWHSQGLHLLISIGTLGGLAMFTFIENFRSTSPFAEMLPEASDYYEHPILATRTFWEVFKLTTQHKSVLVNEKRKRGVADVVKRAEYRKAHGLEQTGKFGKWTLKTDKELINQILPARDSQAAPLAESSEGDSKSRRKWFGIF